MVRVKLDPAVGLWWLHLKYKNFSPPQSLSLFYFSSVIWYNRLNHFCPLAVFPHQDVNSRRAEKDVIWEEEVSQDQAWWEFCSDSESRSGFQPASGSHRIAGPKEERALTHSRTSSSSSRIRVLQVESTYPLGIPKTISVGSQHLTNCNNNNTEVLYAFLLY